MNPAAAAPLGQAALTSPQPPACNISPSGDGARMGASSSYSLNPTEHLIKKLWFLLFPLPTVLVFYQFFTLAQCIATKIHTPADRAGGRNEYTGTSWPGIDPLTAEQDNVQPLTCNIIPFLNTSFTSPQQPTTTTKWSYKQLCKSN